MAFLTTHSQLVSLWGFLATCAMACVQEGSEALALSRISFPLLIGSFFCGNRRRAEAIGFACYLLGGWIYAFAYDWAFHLLGGASIALGAGLGLFQGLFMLLICLPLLPSIHPRMASPYDGPEAARRIEPPGFFALNYGASAAFIHLLGQALFGAILGYAFAAYSV